MKNGDEPAFACSATDQDAGAEGLTKREYMATHIWAAMLGGAEANPNGSAISPLGAVELADDLLQQLRKE